MKDELRARVCTRGFEFVGVLLPLVASENPRISELH